MANETKRRKFLDAMKVYKGALEGCADAQIEDPPAEPRWYDKLTKSLETAYNNASKARENYLNSFKKDVKIKTKLIVGIKEKLPVQQYFNMYPLTRQFLDKLKKEGNYTKLPEENVDDLTKMKDDDLKNVKACIAGVNQIPGNAVRPRVKSN